LYMYEGVFDCKSPLMHLHLSIELKLSKKIPTEMIIYLSLQFVIFHT
jgi:hypothetical protein